MPPLLHAWTLLRRRACPAAAFLFVLVMWWGITGMGMVERFFLPKPWDTLHEGLQMLQTLGFWRDLGWSWFRILCGFLLAALTAIPVGVGMGRVCGFRQMTEPIISFIRFVPMPAVIPLMILWFGSGEWGKIVSICLGVFFQLVLMVADAVSNVPTAYYDIAHSVHVTRWQRLRLFTLPAAMPAIWNSLRINFGLAWATLIFAEILGATSGLGYLIVRSQRYLLTERIFVAVFAIGIMGILVDAIFVLVYKRFFLWSVQGQIMEANR